MRKARFSKEQVTGILQEADRDPITQDPAHAVQLALRAKTKWFGFIEGSELFGVRSSGDDTLLSI